MNKLAIITGGTRGIGKQIALTFAKEGYNIAINYRTENEDLKNTKKEIEENSIITGKVLEQIINISSVVGISGNAGQTNYSASKAGIIGFTKSLAKEVASRNITVNAVAPGFIETQMTDVLKEDIKEEIAKKIPLKRMGTPQDVANVVKFLASNDSSYITGQVINIDGGMLM